MCTLKTETFVWAAVVLLVCYDADWNSDAIIWDMPEAVVVDIAVEVEVEEEAMVLYGMVQFGIDKVEMTEEMVVVVVVVACPMLVSRKVSKTH